MKKNQLLSCCLAFISLIGAQNASAVTYAVKSEVSNGSSGSVNATRTALYVIDDSGAPSALTLTSQRILKDGFGGDIFLDGLAMTKNGTLYGFVNSTRRINNPTLAANTQLVGINPTTGVLTNVGAPISGASISGAAFNFNNELYAINAVNNALIRVDSSNGAVLSIVNLDLTTVNPNISTATITNMERNDLAFDTNNQAYVVLGKSSNFSNNSLYRLDVTTGALIGPNPAAFLSRIGTKFGGFALTGNNHGVLFDGIVDDEIFTFNNILTNLQTTLANNAPVRLNLSQPPANIVGNAGTLDLAAMPNAVTANPVTLQTNINTPINSINPVTNDTQLLSASLAEVPTLDTTFTLQTSAGGTAVYNGVTIDYTPASGFVGSEVITYRVGIPSGSRVTGTITIRVAAAPAQQIPTVGIWSLIIMMFTTLLLAYRYRAKFNRA